MITSPSDLRRIYLWSASSALQSVKSYRKQQHVASTFWHRARFQVLMERVCLPLLRQPGDEEGNCIYMIAPYMKCIQLNSHFGNLEYSGVVVTWNICSKLETRRFIIILSCYMYCMTPVTNCHRLSVIIIYIYTIFLKLVPQYSRRPFCSPNFSHLTREHRKESCKVNEERNKYEYVFFCFCKVRTK